jgi:hypothetical protein
MENNRALDAPNPTVVAGLDLAIPVFICCA